MRQWLLRYQDDRRRAGTDAALPLTRSGHLHYSTHHCLLSIGLFLSPRPHLRKWTPRLQMIYVCVPRFLACMCSCLVNSCIVHFLMVNFLRCLYSVHLQKLALDYSQGLQIPCPSGLDGGQWHWAGVSEGLSLWSLSPWAMLKAWELHPFTAQEHYRVPASWELRDPSWGHFDTTFITKGHGWV